MIVTLDEKRRLTVPVALAAAAPGDAFDAHFDAEEDAIVFRRVKRRGSWLNVPKACPVPWRTFRRAAVSIPASESCELAARRRRSEPGGETTS